MLFKCSPQHGSTKIRETTAPHISVAGRFSLHSVKSKSAVWTWLSWETAVALSEMAGLCIPTAPLLPQDSPLLLPEDAADVKICLLTL